MCACTSLEDHAGKLPATQSLGPQTPDHRTTRDFKDYGHLNWYDTYIFLTSRQLRILLLLLLLLLLLPSCGSAGCLTWVPTCKAEMPGLAPLTYPPQSSTR